MKSPRKISTDEFMQLVRDEFDNLMNPKKNKEFTQKMAGLVSKISDEIKAEVESLTYVLTDEFYDSVEQELKTNILSRISSKYPNAPANKDAKELEAKPNLIDEIVAKYSI